MANKATLDREEITAYIGEERAALLSSFTPEDWDRFSKFNIDLDKSYFVRGSKENLDKFEAFFLMCCGYKKPLYAKYLLSEYIAHVGPVIITEDSDVSFSEKDLLILYLHNNLLGTGNSEAWVFTAALNKITNRNRLGFKTLILSERNVNLFDTSSELVNIKLAGSKAVQTPKEEPTKGTVTNPDGTSGSNNKGEFADSMKDNTTY